MDLTGTNLLKMPEQLFKYYGLNPQYDESRLSGGIFMANPYMFNDPLDCQLNVVNNTEAMIKDKGDDWLINKIFELGYNSENSRNIAEELKNGKEDVLLKVRRSQLTKVGILCLTPEYNDILMWGYYTNNVGFCIEYNPQIIAHDIVIGFINSMDYILAKHLFETKKYGTAIFNADYYKEKIELANKIFLEEDVKKITNRYFENVDKKKILIFIKNVFLKRLEADPVNYDSASQKDTPTLFYNQMKSQAISKYYNKTSNWKHENEFRIVLSLGGNVSIKLSKECVKSVRCGCNMSNDQIIRVLYLLYKNNLNIPVYKMTRDVTDAQLIESEEIPLDNLYKSFKEISDKLNV